MLTTWGLDAIDAPEVWSQGYRGQDVTVAVIDSGIDVHADLLPNVWVNSGEQMNGRDDDGNGYIDDLNGWNFVDDNNNPIGKHNHGTHVAGTIAADLNDFGTTGVAYEAKIMPLRVFNESGVGNTHDIADAVRYAVKNGADVINLSIGGTATRSLKLALEYAAKENVLVVAAAGNDSFNEPSFPAIQSAHWSHVISVGGHNQRFEAIESSNRVGSSKAVQVDAPGVSILSTVTKNEFARKGGTSSATAHVAGIAALMISANEHLTAAELRNALIASASKSVIGSDSVGAVNALRAVALVAGGFTGTNFKIANEADFNSNGEVDFTDLMTLMRNFGRNNVDHRTGDTNGDGRVGFVDFLTLAKNYGEGVPEDRSREFADLASAIAQAPANVTDVAVSNGSSISNSTRRPSASTNSTTTPSTTNSPTTTATATTNSNADLVEEHASILLQSLLTLRGRDSAEQESIPVVPQRAPSVATPAVITPPLTTTPITPVVSTAPKPPTPVIKEPEPVEVPTVVTPTSRTPAPVLETPTKTPTNSLATIEPDASDAAIIDVIVETPAWSAGSLMLNLFSSRKS